MKKFVIFIFTMFGLMVGVFALMLSSYYRAYENFHNHSSNSGSKVTYPAQKYSSSSSSTEYDYKKSNTNYEQNSSSSTLDEDIPDNLIPYVKEARSMLKYFTYSKQSCKESLMRRYKLSEDDAQYVAKLVREKFGYESFLINTIGATIGTHSGPGTVALFFMGEYR